MCMGGSSGAPTSSVAPANYYSSPAATSYSSPGQIVSTGTQSVGGHTFTQAYAPSSYNNYTPPSNYSYSPTTNTYGANAYSPISLSSQAIANPALRAPANITNNLIGGAGGLSLDYSKPKNAIQGQSMYSPGGVQAQGAKGFLGKTEDFLKSISGQTKNEKGEQSKNWLPEIGSLLTSLIPQPKDTRMNSKEALASVGTAATPEGAAARAKMIQFINNPETIGGEATNNYLSAIDRDIAFRENRELDLLKAEWAQNDRPTYGSDWDKARNDLLEQQRIRRDTETTQIRAQLYNAQVNAQLQMISQAYGLDMKLLQDMMSLDIGLAAQKYGMSVKEVDDFRKAVQAMIEKGTS